MHEFGIAQGIVDYAIFEADRKNASKVVEIQVDVGELTMVERPILSHALRLLMAGPRLGGCKVRIRKKAVLFTCRKCSASLPMSEVMKQIGRVPEDLLVREPDSKEVPMHFLPSLYPAFIHCPNCGSADLEATGGEGVSIRSMVLK